MVNTVFGVAMSLAGSVAVAPAALGRLREMARADGGMARDALAQVIPALRRKPEMRVGRGSVAATVGVGTGRAFGWATFSTSDLTTEERFALLDQRMENFQKQLLAAEQRSEKANKELRELIKATEAGARRRSEALGVRIDRMEVDQVELNAAAFPLIGFGIVISGLDTQLASLPVWADVSVLVLATVVSVRVVGPNVLRWQRDRRERKAIEHQESRAIEEEPPA